MFVITISLSQPQYLIPNNIFTGYLHSNTIKQKQKMILITFYYQFNSILKRQKPIIEQFIKYMLSNRLMQFKKNLINLK